MCPPPSKWVKFFPIRYRHTNIHIIHINIWVFPIKIPGFPFWSHDSDGSMVEPLLFSLLRPGCTPKLCTPREPTVLQKDTCVRIRLTQSRLEMALSSVNPPSSYRLKQTGDIGEDRESPSLCTRAQSAKSMHVLTVQCEKTASSLMPQGRIVTREQATVNGLLSNMLSPQPWQTVPAWRWQRFPPWIFSSILAMSEISTLADLIRSRSRKPALSQPGTHTDRDCFNSQIYNGLLFHGERPRHWVTVFQGTREPPHMLQRFLGPSRDGIS